MNDRNNVCDEDLIDLGEASVETHGGNGGSIPDSPQPRVLAGILAD